MKMGINDSFSNWLKGAKSTATSTLRAAHAQVAALQQQTMTAVSGAQRAVQQVITPRASTPSTSPHTTKTLIPTDLIEGAARAVQGGVQAVQAGVDQVVKAHAPIVQDIQRDAGRVIQSAPPVVQQSARIIGGAGAAQPFVATRAPSTPTGPSAGVSAPTQRSVSPFAVASQSSARVAQSSAPRPAATQASTLTPLQRQEQYIRDVERFNASPGLTQLPGLIEQHQQRSQAYQIDPELRRYEQKLSAYNAQRSAHEQAISRNQGRQETANRLNLMQQELEGMRSSINARKDRELAEIRALGANIQSISAPIQAEYQRLLAEERALTKSAARAETPRSPDPVSAILPGITQFAAAHAPIIRGLERDFGRAVAPVRPYIDFANQRKAAAQAELTRRAGPARSFEQGWTYPVYQGGQALNVGYQRVVAATEPIWSFTNPLRSVPEARALQGGFARAPGKFVEDLTWLAPAAERVGQITWKEPHKLPATVAQFAGDQYAGISDAWERDPWGTVGEVAGELAIGFGVGGLAKGKVAPSTMGKGAGGSAPPAPRPRAGHRFSGLEFGFQVKQIPKPQTSAPKPFRLSEWQAERAKYADRPSTITPTRSPAPVIGEQVKQIQKPAPAPASAKPWVVADWHAERAKYGSQASLSRAPVNQQQSILENIQIPRISAMGMQQMDQIQTPVTASSKTVQPTESREESVLALLYFPVINDLIQPLVTDTIQVLDQTQKTDLVPPLAPLRGPRVVPLYRLPRVKEKKKDPEGRRERRKKKGEADHWEFGPAPGTGEMAGMIFGAAPARSIKGSLLDFGPPSIGVRGTSPDRNRNKPAHAGKKMPKKRSPRKQKTTK